MGTDTVSMDHRDVEGRVDKNPVPQNDEQNEDSEESVEKGIGGPEYYATSFEELESAERMVVASENVLGLVDRFKSIVATIMTDKSVDQQSAINRVVQEFMQRVEKTMHHEKEATTEENKGTGGNATQTISTTAEKAGAGQEAQEEEQVMAESDTESAVELSAREAYKELGFSDSEIPKSAEQETGVPCQSNCASLRSM